MLFATSPASAQSAATETVAEQGSLQLFVSQGTVTLESDGAPLGQVLDALAAKAGFTADLPAGLASSQVSLVFDGLPMDAALWRILEGTSFLLEYDQGPEGTNARRRVTSVRVLATGSRRGGGGLTEYIRLAGNSPTGAGTSDAATALSDSMHAEGDLAQQQAIGRLADVSQAGKEPMERIRALEGLGEWSGEDKARMAILQALNDPDPGVRRTAVTVLGSMNSDVELIDALAKVVLNDESPDIRKLGLNTLVMTYPQDEVISFVQKATLDPDPEVRDRAQMLLRGMGVDG